jgi:hypothetical protein
MCWILSLYEVPSADAAIATATKNIDIIYAFLKG